MTIPLVPETVGLRVGFVPGVTLTKWRTIWRERFPRVSLEVVELAVADQRRALTAEEVDLCFVRLPLDSVGLHVIRLYDEVPVAWVSKDHPLAALSEVSNADLVDESVLVDADPGSIDLVAQAQAVLRVPMSIARSHSRRDLVYRPVTDAPVTTVALAWRVDNHHGSIDEFIGVVRGRTVNSSRTAQDRAAGQGEVPRPKRAAAPKPARRTGSGRRPRRR